MKNFIIQKALQFFILFLTTISFSQISSKTTSVLEVSKLKPFKIISFSEKINFGNIENSSTFNISNSKENFLISKSGNQINNFEFDNPGFYEIVFSEANTKHSSDCKHNLLPEKMIIEVSPVKMKFDFSKISFSEKIISNVACDNIIITIPIYVTLKNIKSEIFRIPSFNVSGIGSDLKAIPLQEEITITNGMHLIKYKLSGTVKKETYLMFDFVDFNNQIQTYNQPEKIN